MSSDDIGAADKVHPGNPVIVDRYTPGARANHWVTAICLIALALSGLALFTPSLYFLTGLFGGGQLTRTIHPWIGVVLFFSFSGLFFRFWKLNLWKREDNKWLAQAGDLAPVQLGGRHQQPGVAHLAAGGDRLRAEGGEQRRDDAAGLQRAEHGDVELGQPPHQHEDAVARRQPQAAQRAREAADRLRQVGVAQVAPVAALADPADRDMRAAAVGDMAVDRLVRDIQPAAGQAGQRLARLRPVEAGAESARVGHVGRHAPAALRLGDARRDACRCGGASLALPGRLRVLAFVHADALSGASLRRGGWPRGGQGHHRRPALGHLEIDQVIARGAAIGAPAAGDRPQ